jgi:hypothetical protein
MSIGTRKKQEVIFRILGKRRNFILNYLQVSPVSPLWNAWVSRYFTLSKRGAIWGILIFVACLSQRLINSLFLSLKTPHKCMCNVEWLENMIMKREWIRIWKEEVLACFIMLSLCFNLIPRHEVWRSGFIDPNILKLGTGWRRAVGFKPRPIYPLPPEKEPLVRIG